MFAANDRAVTPDEAGVYSTSMLDLDDATYFISQITLVRGDGPGMSRWRKKLFLGLSRTSTSPVEFFCLPEHRIVTMGSFIEL